MTAPRWAQFAFQAFNGSTGFGGYTLQQPGVLVGTVTNATLSTVTTVVLTRAASFPSSTLRLRALHPSTRACSRQPASRAEPTPCPRRPRMTPMPIFGMSSAT
jgi:hypothetical protein